MVHLSPPENPAILKGIKVHPDNPFRFDFILDKGDSAFLNLRGSGGLKEESTKLIKYFLASLTIPEKDLWVNLSPYEKDRIVPDSFGVTEMGRDLLAQDYMLKQITASLIYPEDEVGKKFWKRIYEEAAKKYNTTNIPVNTFNKVWIVPEKAVVYENVKAGTAYVVESKLKVMLESDYLSMTKHNVETPFMASEECKDGDGINAVCTGKDINALGSQIIREIVIPELTKEINEGKNFSQLRQVYNSLILATWYKKKIKDSILSKFYADKSKTQGINIEDPQEKEKIYQQYLQAFKKGVYNYIKEDKDPITQQATPRKYFSGGVTFLASPAMTTVNKVDAAQLSGDFAQVTADLRAGEKSLDMAMRAKSAVPKIVEGDVVFATKLFGQLFVGGEAQYGILASGLPKPKDTGEYFELKIAGNVFRLVHKVTGVRHVFTLDQESFRFLAKLKGWQWKESKQQELNRGLPEKETGDVSIARDDFREFIEGGSDRLSEFLQKYPQLNDPQNDPKPWVDIVIENVSFRFVRKRSGDRINYILDKDGFNQLATVMKWSLVNQDVEQKNESLPIINEQDIVFSSAGFSETVTYGYKVWKAFTAEEADLDKARFDPNPFKEIVIQSRTFQLVRKKNKTNGNVVYTLSKDEFEDLAKLKGWRLREKGADEVEVLEEDPELTDTEEVKQVKALLKHLLLRPKNHDWRTDKDLIKSLVGRSLGKTIVGGKISVTVDPGYFNRIPLAMGDFAGFEVKVVRADIQENLINFVFSFEKAGEISFQRRFQLGYSTKNVSYKNKDEKPDLEVLDLDEKMGSRALSYFVRQSEDFNWLEHESDLPNMVGMRIGESLRGVISFSPIEYFPYPWYVFGETEDGWEGTIISQQAYSNRFEFTVRFIKGGERKTVTYQIGRMTRILSGQGPFLNQRERVLVISSKLGLLTLEKILAETDMQRRASYDLKGLSLGKTDKNGRYRLNIDGFPYDWVSVGVLGEGWEGTVTSFDNSLGFTVEFKKDDQVFSRTFKISPQKKVLKNYFDPKLGTKEVLSIIPLSKIKLPREVLLNESRKLISNDNPGRLFRLLREQVDLNLFQGVGRFSLARVENSRYITQEIFDSLLTVLKQAYENDGRLSLAEVEQLMQDAFLKLLEKRRAEWSSRNEFKKIERAKNARPERNGGERLLRDLSLERRVPSKEIQDYWERKDVQGLYFGLTYMIEEEIFKLGELYSKTLFSESFSAGNIVLRRVFGLEMGEDVYDPVKHGEFLEAYLRKQLRLMIPEIVKEDTKKVAGVSLDAPVEDDNRTILDTVPSEMGRETVESWNDLRNRLNRVQEAVKEQGLVLNGNIVHWEEKRTKIQGLKEFLERTQIIYVLQQEQVGFGVYLSGQWGQMAFTNKSDPLEVVMVIDKPHQQLNVLASRLSDQLKARTVMNNGTIQLESSTPQGLMKIKLVSSRSGDVEDIDPLMDIFANSLPVYESHQGFSQRVASQLFDELGEDAGEYVIGYYEEFLTRQREIVENLLEETNAGFTDKAMLSDELEQADQAMKAADFVALLRGILDQRKHGSLIQKLKWQEDFISGLIRLRTSNHKVDAETLEILNTIDGIREKETPKGPIPQEVITALKEIWGSMYNFYYKENKEYGYLDIAKKAADGKPLGSSHVKQIVTALIKSGLGHHFYKTRYQSALALKALVENGFIAGKDLFISEELIKSFDTLDYSYPIKLLIAKNWVLSTIKVPTVDWERVMEYLLKVLKPEDLTKANIEQLITRIDSKDPQVIKTTTDVLMNVEIISAAAFKEAVTRERRNRLSSPYVDYAAPLRGKLYLKSMCNFMVSAFMDFLPQNLSKLAIEVAPAKVEGLSHLAKDLNFHQFIVVSDENKKLWLIDPTYQQFLDEKDISDEKPKVLVVPLAEALNKLQELGVSSKDIGLWREGILNNPKFNQWIASLDQGQGIDFRFDSAMVVKKESDQAMISVKELLAKGADKLKEIRRNRAIRKAANNFMQQAKATSEVFKYDDLRSEFINRPGFRKSFEVFEADFYSVIKDSFPPLEGSDAVRIQQPGDMLGSIVAHYVYKYESDDIKLDYSYEYARSMGRVDHKGNNIDVGWKLYLLVQPHHIGQVKEYLKEKGYLFKLWGKKGWGQQFDLYIGSWDLVNELSRELQKDLRPFLLNTGSPLSYGLDEDGIAQGMLLESGLIARFASLDDGFDWSGDCGIPNIKGYSQGIEFQSIRERFKYTLDRYGDYFYPLDSAQEDNDQDSAQLNQDLNKGGIDFNSDQMNLETRNEGEKIKFNMTLEMLEQFQNAPGFYPVIINIQPMTDLKGFLTIG